MLEISYCKLYKVVSYTTFEVLLSRQHVQSKKCRLKLHVAINNWSNGWIHVLYV